MRRKVQRRRKARVTGKKYELLRKVLRGKIQESGEKREWKEKVLRKK